MDILVFKRKIVSAWMAVWLSPVGGIGIGIEGGCNMQMFEQRNVNQLFVSVVLACVY